MIRRLIGIYGPHIENSVDMQTPNLLWEIFEKNHDPIKVFET